MIDVELSQVILVDAQLHLRLRLADSLLHFVPRLVLQLMVLNLQGHAKEVSNVPVVDDVEKDGDGPEDPEDAGDEDEGVGPEGEPVVALAG
jgi:hypothetical protein